MPVPDITSGEAFTRFRHMLNQYGSRKTPFVFAVDYKGVKPRVWRIDETDPSEIAFDFRGFSNVGSSPAPESGTVRFRKYPVSFETYETGFKNVIHRIKKGDSFLVNYSQPTPVETNLSLRDIFQRSTAPYRMWLRDEFVCFSPEVFLTIQENLMASHPMKGTLDAGLPDAAALLLSNPKETAEHATIVDLIRNDLSRVARKVWVERYRYLETIRTLDKELLQMSSEIRGILPSGFNNAFGDLLAHLLPAGSVTGAPKPSTLDIIEASERYDRGYYTGVMGYFDGTTFDSAVMIRYIEHHNGRLVFKSGGGITARSNCRTEYQEMIDKVYLPFPIQA